MGTSDANAQLPAGQQTLQLPPGWTIGVGRETGQTSPQGQVVQGIAWTITSPNGTGTTIFVPYSMVANISQVQGLFDARIAAITAIGG